MGERRGEGLAARFRASIEARVAEKRRAEAELKARQARGREERTKVLSDLAAFGEQVGHFDVTVGEDVVIFRYDDRTIRFEAQGIADRLVVRGDGLDKERRIFLHSQLDKWVLTRELTGGREDQEMLFDTGIIQLMGAVFEVQPSEEGTVVVPASEAVEPSEDAVVERTL